jgi:hypothetical protein
VVTTTALLIEHPAVLVLVIAVGGLAVAGYRATLPPYQPTSLMGQQYPQDLTRRLTQGPAQHYKLALYLAAPLQAKWHGFQTSVRVQGSRTVERP